MLKQRTPKQATRPLGEVITQIGGEDSQALHGIQGVVGDGEPTIVQESEAVPPNAEDTFSLDLSPVIEEEGGSSLVETVVIATGAQKRGWKRSLLSKDDDHAFKSLLK